MDKTGKFYQKRKERYSLQPSASLTLESAFVFPFFFLRIQVCISVFIPVVSKPGLCTGRCSQFHRFYRKQGYRNLKQTSGF